MTNAASATINAKIAYDIDKIEPLLQYYHYHVINSTPNNLDTTDFKASFSSWENEVFHKLKTPLGKRILLILKQHIWSTLEITE